MSRFDPFLPRPFKYRYKKVLKARARGLVAQVFTLGFVIIFVNIGKPME